MHRLRWFFEAIASDYKQRSTILAFIVPFIVIARYALFENAVEIGFFAQQLKKYVTPLLIVLSVMLLAGIIVVAVKKVDELHRKNLVTGFFWFSSIVLVLAIAAVFADVKLRGNQSSDQSSRSVVVL